MPQHQQQASHVDKAWGDLQEAVRNAGHFFDIQAKGLIETQRDPNARPLAQLRDALRTVRFLSQPAPATSGAEQ